ncbi:murein hydrolase activator EnvC [Moritella sp. F3]|uniref:murein hydrolase activator EnvC family protein n=1 Tax=Moritella sp. F3 TaxID=2718882 RepID=UPI0018E17D59|nr:peptidoglycan DD-metalloendopeptidase family protein [Moritella sp. F3]GIC76058.1 non-catalytic member of peptidase subfamily M23B [Moritella sp. F1]GIC82840.1 non-catalytic member of peptidase subfamily M23B [Moritella sp. F3]
MTFIKNSMAYSVIGLLILLSLNTYAANNQSELNQLRNQIKVQDASIKKQHRYLNDLSKQTQSTDRAISKVAAQLSNTESLITNIEQDLNALVIKQKALLKSKKKQQNILSAQIETAYLSGNNDYLKLLLNQQNTNEIERSLVYYQHLHTARAASIAEFNDTLAEIEKNEIEQEKIKQQLLVIKASQQQKAKQLAQQKSQQKKSNRNIAYSINKQKKTRTELGIAAQKLKQQIALLRKQQEIALLKKQQSAQISLSGLKQYKGKLDWPIKGKVLHNFNSKRFNNVSWRGLVISASEGSKVKAVSAGKVVFADWLRGFGMVTIIDHGKGYMSLYGHNQTLLKVTGEKVRKGDVISLAGRSGGQLESGVYFEIRHKGKAVNPRSWLKR